MTIMIISIETSCDETAVAIAKPYIFDGQKCVEIISSVVASQIDIHKKYGGVVPEVAARAHVESMIPVIDEALSKADITLEQIDGIAVTWEPGLMPSLLVGRSSSQALAQALKKPLIKVNHIMGHIYANWIFDKDDENFKTPKFPVIALVVSGGHTGIWLINDFGKEEQLGNTLDDAAGEAFDKAARLLDLGYPGGPAISKASEKGNPRLVSFPRPKIDSDDFDFSFSGLKTSIVREIELRGKEFVEKHKNDFAASVEQSIVDTLVFKTVKAAKKYSAKSVIIAGGVSANKKLRETMQKEVIKNNMQFFTPKFEYCTDNAAMIASSALLHE